MSTERVVRYGQLPHGATRFIFVTILNSYNKVIGKLYRIMIVVTCNGRQNSFLNIAFVRSSVNTLHLLNQLIYAFSIIVAYLSKAKLFSSTIEL
jgi:hypothetical protein